MKFIVTGGAGFIGSHLSRFLIKNNHDVIVIDDLCRGNLANLTDIENDVDFHQINILDFEKLNELSNGIDGIFHQAALGSVPQSFKEPALYYDVIATGTENLLKIAQKQNCKIIYASSSSVYGNQTEFPIKEDVGKNPINPYGKAKLAAEKFAEKYVNDDVSVIGLRYFNVYGIGQNPSYAGVIPIFLDRLAQHKSPVIEGDGTHVRSFSFIDDVVEANWKSFTSKTKHAFINIASTETTSINELAKIMINISGLSLEPEYTDPRPGDIDRSEADITLAKELIDWEPITSLENGLKKIFPKIE